MTFIAPNVYTFWLCLSCSTVHSGWLNIDKGKEKESQRALEQVYNPGTVIWKLRCFCKQCWTENKTYFGASMCEVYSGNSTGHYTLPQGARGFPPLVV